MKKYRVILLFLAYCLLGSSSFALEPMSRPEIGRIDRIALFPSEYVDPRNVDVWLPTDFDALKASGERFHVIYMHDGQMLFDPSTTWNKQAWHVDKTIDKLVKANKIPHCIVVGIWNNGIYRHSEYFPEKFLLNMSKEFRDNLIQTKLRGKPQSDAYLKFIVDELKPYIDSHYPTRPDAPSTLIMGSSMGGLISVYALSEYPNIFGSAAGLSTHWIGITKPNLEIPQSAYDYLRHHFPDTQKLRLYQDHGSLGLDSLYGAYQVTVNEIIKNKFKNDMTPNTSFMTLTFEGMDHSENDWAKRLEIPLTFIFSNR